MFIIFIFRQESPKQGDRERRQNYKKQDEEREVVRSTIRDKYGIAKHQSELDDDDDEEDVFESKNDNGEGGDDPLIGKHNSIAMCLFSGCLS